MQHHWALYATRADRCGHHLDVAQAIACHSYLSRFFNARTHALVDGPGLAEHVRTLHFHILEADTRTAHTYSVDKATMDRQLARIERQKLLWRRCRKRTNLTAIRNARGQPADSPDASAALLAQHWGRVPLHVVKTIPIGTPF